MDNAAQAQAQGKGQVIDNFLKEIWHSVTHKQIPSLFALSCATIYLAMPQTADHSVTAIQCDCNITQQQREYFHHAIAECYDETCSLWELIQRAIKLENLGEKCRHIELMIQEIELAEVERLKLPKIFKNYIMLPKKVPGFYGGDTKGHHFHPLPHGKVAWSAPECGCTEQSRDIRLHNYKMGAITKSEHDKCIQGLDPLKCICMLRNQSLTEWMDECYSRPANASDSE